MSKHLKLLHYEPAGSKETPEELNDRIQHVLQRMSANRHNVTRQNQSNSKESTQNRTIDQHNFKHGNLAPKTYENRHKITSNIKKLSEVKTNETTDERNARVAESLNQISEVVMVKEQNTRSLTKEKESVQESENSTKKVDNDDISMDIPEEDETTDQKDFTTLLSFFLKQAHKPPNPPAKNQAESMKTQALPKTSKAESADAQIKTENTHDDKLELVENPLEKKDVRLNADTSKDSEGLRENHKLEFNNSINNASDIKLDNKIDLEDSMLRKKAIFKK